MDVSLPNPPRPRAAARPMRLHAGLGLHYFGALAVPLGPWINAIVAIWKGTWSIEQLVAPIVFSFVGAMILADARRRYNHRMRAFVNGLLCEGRVRSSSKVDVAWKSAGDVLVYIDVALPDGSMRLAQLQTSDGAIARELRDGTKLQVLFDPANGATLYPIELGLRIVQRT